jgi:hypothetical protein
MSAASAGEAGWLSNQSVNVHTQPMGSSNFGAPGTAAFVAVAPPMTKTVRGTNGCAMASDRG